MKRTLLVYLSMVLVFAGCEDKKTETKSGTPVYRFKMSQNDKVSLQEICDSVNLIVLQMLPLEARMLKSYKDRYYVYNREKVFVLDRQGKQVNEIISKTKEEGLYDKIADVVIDPFNETLLLLSEWKGVLEYTLDGKFLGVYRPQGSLYRVFPVSKDVFACLRKTPEKKIHYFSREKNSYISSTFTVPEIFGSTLDLYGYMKDQVSYGAYHFLNTYYRIELNKVVPAYHFTTGRSPYLLSQLKKPPFKKPEIKGKLSKSTLIEYHKKQTDWLYENFPVRIGASREWGDWILADFKHEDKNTLNTEYFYVLCNTKARSCRKFSTFSEGIEFPVHTYLNQDEIVYLCDGGDLSPFVSYYMLDEQGKRQFSEAVLTNSACIVRLKLK